MRLKKTAKNSNNKSNASMSGKSVIGLEIGQTHIRMVQVSGKGANRVVLEKYAIVPLRPNIMVGNDIADFDELVSHLQQCYKKLKSSCKAVNLALPAGLVTVDESLRYDSGNSELTLQEFVETEVVHLGALDDMNYDWQVLSRGSRGEQAVLMVATRSEVVNQRQDLLEEIGLKVENMDVDLFGIANAFAYADSADANEFAQDRIALFDVGDMALKALIMEDGQILYKHESNFGADQLVQLIQRTYHVRDDEAWDMINGDVERPSDYHTEIADYFNMQIAQEVQRVLQFFFTTQNVDHDIKIKQIFISGSACSPESGLAEVVYGQTGVATQQIAPITMAMNKLKGDGERLHRDANSLTIAFGLAVRGLA